MPRLDPRMLFGHLSGRLDLVEGQETAPILEVAAS